MITSVKVRNCVLGQGRPKICVPIVARTREEVKKAAQEISGLPADMVEWRADWYEALNRPEEVAGTLNVLRAVLGEAMPILFTLRTKKEGGQAELPTADYVAINLAAVAAEEVDLVDVELSTGKEGAAMIVEAAHQIGKKVIMSCHDFYRTPEVEEMIAYLKRMQEWNADIPKLAVMPKSKVDVLKLLTATLEMREKYADRPIITMSMAAEGVISRLAGETFGSCLTFGCAGQASAPGQMEVTELYQILELVHKSMG